MPKCRNFYGQVVLVTAPATADTLFAVAHGMDTTPRGAFVVKQTSPLAQLYAAMTAPAGLSVNLVGGWEFENNASLGQDSGPQGLTLTNNGADQVAGVVGNGAQCILANSDFLTRASEPAIQMGNIDFTYCTWVKLTDKLTQQMIVSKEGVGAVNADYDIYYAPAATDRFITRIWIPTGGASAVANNLGSPAAGTWYFIVAWHDSVADTINIQVNDGVANSVATGGALQAPAAGALQFGARDNGVSRSFLNGYIDQVMMWKRKLTAAERTTLYNGGAGVTVAAVTPPSTPVPWTASEAYLMSSAANAVYYVMFFI